MKDLLKMWNSFFNLFFPVWNMYVYPVFKSQKKNPTIVWTWNRDMRRRHLKKQLNNIRYYFLWHLKKSHVHKYDSKKAPLYLNERVAWCVCDDRYRSLAGIDVERLLALINESFDKRLRRDYIDSLQGRVHAIYLSEGWDGTERFQTISGVQALAPQS